ncbi:MAG: T9SS type A sorting domain-containing protein [Bacteroidota bacterium]
MRVIVDNGIAIINSDKKLKTTECKKTNIENLTNSDTIDIIKVYPNPASEKIIITANNDNINAIEIYNEKGENVFQSANQQTDQFTINLRSLPTGIYLLKIKTEKKQFIQKIIVQY